MDAFEFVLAETLKCTVAELRERLSSYEYVQWQAFFNYRHEMQMLELKKQESKRAY